MGRNWNLEAIVSEDLVDALVYARQGEHISGVLYAKTTYLDVHHAVKGPLVFLTHEVLSGDEALQAALSSLPEYFAEQMSFSMRTAYFERMPAGTNAPMMRWMEDVDRLLEAVHRTNNDLFQYAVLVQSENAKHDWLRIFEFNQKLGRGHASEMQVRVATAEEINRFLHNRVHIDNMKLRDIKAYTPEPLELSAEPDSAQVILEMEDDDPIDLRRDTKKISSDTARDIPVGQPTERIVPVFDVPPKLSGDTLVQHFGTGGHNVTTPAPDDEDTNIHRMPLGKPVKKKDELPVEPRDAVKPAGDTESGEEFTLQDMVKELKASVENKEESVEQASNVAEKPVPLTTSAFDPGDEESTDELPEASVITEPEPYVLMPDNNGEEKKMVKQKFGILGKTVVGATLVAMLGTAYFIGKNSNVPENKGGPVSVLGHTDKEVNDLKSSYKTQIDQLTGDLTSAKDALSKAQESESSNSSKIGSLESEVKRLEGELQKAKADFEKANSDYNKIKSDYNSVNNENAALKNKVSDLEKRIVEKPTLELKVDIAFENENTYHVAEAYITALTKYAKIDGQEVSLDVEEARAFVYGRLAGKDYLISESDLMSEVDRFRKASSLDILVDFSQPVDAIDGKPVKKLIGSFEYVDASLRDAFANIIEVYGVNKAKAIWALKYLGRDGSSQDDVKVFESWAKQNSD